MLTAMVYLTGNLAGGRTIFPSVNVGNTPEAGSLLFWDTKEIYTFLAIANSEKKLYHIHYKINLSFHLLVLSIIFLLFFKKIIIIHNNCFPCF